MSTPSLFYPIPAYRQPSLLEQRIAVLKWRLDGLPARTNLRRLILDGLREHPLPGDEERYDLFLKLATAVAVRDGLTPLDVRCYHEWRGMSLQKCSRIASDPEIRQLLGYGPSINMYGWVRHDWLKFKAWLRRVFHRSEEG